jgi:S-adenosylmethionine:tRNA ribosyltransferase-isomerase
MNLSGRKSSNGQDRDSHDPGVEFEQTGKITLECLVKGKIKVGQDLEFESIPIKAKIAEHIEEGRYYVDIEPINMTSKTDEGGFEHRFIQLMEQFGEMPLPPYIKNPIEDPARYQTIYSTRCGSIAAHTAGLHFTEELIEKLQRKGVKICYITLHISYGTFKPVRVENVSDHKMDYEYYRVSPETAELLNEARSDKCLTAVGTTAVRTLETIFKNTESVSACEGTTELFIYPGYEFRAGINRLLPKFHFPKSTLLMLVSAFAGTSRILKAYETAKQNNYRFYSYGDAMFVLK